MSPATPDQLAAAAPRVVLLTLRWGDSSVARYARYDSDVVVGSDTYTALADLDIEELRLTGDMTPESLVLSGPNDVLPFSTFTSEAKHPRVRCTFGVADPADTATYREFFFGWLALAEPIDGRGEDFYEFEFTGIKAELNRQLGFVADNYCQVWLGHPLCGVDLSAITLTGTLTATNVDGISNRVSISFSGSPVLTNRRWSTGAIIYDSLPLGILAADGTGKFDLEFPVPASWVGQTVTAEPGCNGLQDTCVNEYDNETNMVAFGIDMPDKFPLSDEE